MKAIKFYSLIVLVGMTMGASCQAHASTTQQPRPSVTQVR
jgi:hypothetical protein